MRASIQELEAKLIPREDLQPGNTETMPQVLILGEEPLRFQEREHPVESPMDKNLNSQEAELATIKPQATIVTSLPAAPCKEAKQAQQQAQPPTEHQEHTLDLMEQQPQVDQA